MATVTQQYGFYAYNGWRIANNVWNQGSLVYGTDYLQEIDYTPGDPSSDVQMIWSFPDDTDPITVHSYPEVFYGPSPWWQGVDPTDSQHPFPIQVKQIQGLGASFDLTAAGNTTGYDVAFDIWLTKQPSGGPTSVTNEIMIWLHRGAFNPAGTMVANYSDSFFSGEIYYQQVMGDNSGQNPETWKYTAFVANSDTLKGQVNIASMLGKMKSLGLISGNEYLSDVELGAEVAYGSGSLTVNHLTINLQPVGQKNVVIAPPTPLVTTVVASPDMGDVTTGSLVTLTLTITEPVTVSGGAPTLQLNDGGSATYDAAKSSGTALVFDYTVQSGQTTADLAVIGFNANEAVIQDTTGTSANLAGALITFIGLGINAPLISNLNVNRQLDLIYIGYFNRAADSGGFSFWGGQNTTAQNGGQSAAVALTNIANSFAPQQETDALYPILSTPNLNLQSAGAQTALGTFLDNVYSNLFDRAADAGGKAYWLGQITSGAVGLGAAVLAIANGAQGTDAIEVQNKIAVALDFTTRTGAAGLGTISPYPTTFVTAAHSVLSSVDGVSLNDASVTAGEAATTAYIANPASVGATAVTAANDPVTISASNTVTDPGPGSHTIQFITGVSADTLVLHSGATDQISGFNLAAGDVLDLRSLLSEAQLNIQDVLPKLGSYFTIADQGADAVLLFDPLGHGAGSAVAVLKALSAAVPDIGTLSSHNAILV